MSVFRHILRDAEKCVEKCPFTLANFLRNRKCAIKIICQCKRSISTSLLRVHYASSAPLMAGGSSTVCCSDAGSGAGSGSACCCGTGSGVGVRPVRKKKTKGKKIRVKFFIILTFSRIHVSPMPEYRRCSTIYGTVVNSIEPRILMKSAKIQKTKKSKKLASRNCRASYARYAMN